MQFLDFYVIILKVHKGESLVYDTYSFTQKRDSEFIIKPHSHDKYEFVYFYSGKGTICYGEEKFDFSARSYFLMEPQVIHSHYYSEQSNCLIVWFEAKDKPDLTSTAESDTSITISSLCNRIRTELEDKALNYDKMINALANEIILTLIRNRAGKEKEEVNIDYLLRNTVAYIDEYFTTPLKIYDLASSCGYSADHYRVVFKKATGATPKEYIMEKRLNLAVDLLKNSDMPVHEIAYHCGFEYESQFSRYFKEKFGYSPKNARKSPDNQ